MTTVKIACPSCSTPLRAASEIAFGQTIRCPRCATPFTVRGKSPPPIAYTAPLTSVPPPPLPPVLMVEPVDAPLGGAAAPNRAMLLGVVLGGLGLLAAASIGLALLFAGPGKEKESD